MNICLDNSAVFRAKCDPIIFQSYTTTIHAGNQSRVINQSENVIKRVVNTYPPHMVYSFAFVLTKRHGSTGNECRSCANFR